jgi:uncharacterized membrane protein YraQ (UPF0718 family)
MFFWLFIISVAVYFGLEAAWTMVLLCLAIAGVVGYCKNAKMVRELEEKARKSRDVSSSEPDPIPIRRA